MIDYEWLAACATAGEFLYGYFPVDVLKQMYEKKKGHTVSTSDLIAAMNELEERGEILISYCPGRLDESDHSGIGFYHPTECEGTELEDMMRQADAEGNPYALMHLDEDERSLLLEERPDDLEFYVPDEREITQLVEEGYIWTPEMGKLEDVIKKRGGDPAYLKALWAQVSTDRMDQLESVNAVMNGIFPEARGHKVDSEVPEEVLKKIPSLDDLNAVMPYINDFLNNINLRSRKGWKPAKLFKKMHPNGMTSMPAIMPGSVHAAKMFKEAEPQLRAMGAEVDYSSISNYAAVGQFGERRVIKVGRNDPCPCGSGLKYKRCHGRGK